MNSSGMKGKIDHSSAGAQFVWNNLYGTGDKNCDLAAEMLALAIASHHSGLKDCIAPDGRDVFGERMRKADFKTHLSEVKNNVSPSIMNRIKELLNNPSIFKSFEQAVDLIKKNEVAAGGKKEEYRARVRFKEGILLRMLYSCLIDADRTDTADFENDFVKQHRLSGQYLPWQTLAQRLEEHLATFKNDTAINKGRSHISDCCLQAAKRGRGIFTLTVPTGGGKTLASLRFAINHANYSLGDPHPIERIFYIVPYTSIIDQNARIAREVLERPDEKGSVVLECHSNLSVENECWRTKLLSENWDAPIIFTTSVQFLETLFGSGTKSVRKMHRLANSIIIFDEIQTLPVRTVHMFCNAVNFLVEECGSTVVLCTATQPLLNAVDSGRGALTYSAENEIMQYTDQLFEDFRRVDVIDLRKAGGYTYEEAAELAIKEQAQSGSCLLIANTTKVAKEIYQHVKQKFNGEVVHLSANMCPAHRAEVFEKIKQNLASEPRRPLICISTQVIEAGVDVDFGCVIRCMAGLDSIAQAAGRCNRHGLRDKGRVLIINIAQNDENIDMLTDIVLGQKVTQRILEDQMCLPVAERLDLLSPENIALYFKYYLNDKNVEHEMVYPVSYKVRDDSLLEMLSQNRNAVSDYKNENADSEPIIPLRQSFESAAQLFQSIDSMTQGVIVPFGRGKEIIAELNGSFDLVRFIHLLHEAQIYSVNVYKNKLNKLLNNGAMYYINIEKNNKQQLVLALKEEFYSEEFGLCTDPINKMKLEVK